MLSQLIYSSNLGCHSILTEFSCALSCHVVYGCKLNIWLSGACLMLPHSILCIIELCFVPPSSPEFQREHSYSWGTLTVSMVQHHTTQANKLSRIWNMFKLVWCIMKNNSNLLQSRLWQYWLWSFKFLHKNYQIQHFWPITKADDSGNCKYMY